MHGFLQLKQANNKEKPMLHIHDPMELKDMTICTINEVDILNGQPLTMEMNISWKNKGVAGFVSMHVAYELLRHLGLLG